MNGQDPEITPAHNNGNIARIKYFISGTLQYSQTFQYDPLNRLRYAVEHNNGVYNDDVPRLVSDLRLRPLRESRDRRQEHVRQCGRGEQRVAVEPISARRTIASRAPVFVYDAAGNLIAEPGKSYTYDAENRIVTATVGGVATSQYFYDGNSRRVKKIVGGVATRFEYGAGGELIAERNEANGTVTKDYFYKGGELLATTKTGTTYEYATADHLGTPRAWTDGSGNLIAGGRHDYLPFGEELSAGIGIRSAALGYGADSTRQKFTQKERDAESGLDYFGARYYSSAQGRFTSVDPISIGIAHLVNPQNFNKYVYTLNNPLNRVDISGLFSVEVHKQITVRVLTKLGWSKAAAAKAAAGNASVDQGSSPLKTIEKTLNPFGNNPKHSMRDVYIQYSYPLVLSQKVPSEFERSIRIPTGTEKQSVESAKAEAKAWISNRISAAADALISGDTSQGAFAFGEALHTIQDEKHGWITLEEHFTDVNMISTDLNPTPEQLAKAERDTRAAVNTLFSTIRSKLETSGLSNQEVQERLYEIRNGLRQYK